MIRPSMSRRRFLRIAAAGATLMPFATRAALAEAAGEVPLRSWRGTALGAKAEILIYHSDRSEADRLILLALAEIARLEQVFSLYREDSALSILNREGELRNPPFDLVRLLALSQHYGALTGGAFDVTVQPLWRLYEEHFREPNADPNGPSAESIDRVRQLVGYRNISVDVDRIAMTLPRMAVTLNGIAQGYITDRVADLLAENGLEHVLVDLDEIRALGPRADGTPWKVGIEDPRRPGRSIKTVELSGGAMGTSGGYGTQFDAEGRFNHIFDPSTGRCANRYLSVSVITPLATTADGLSVALSVLPHAAVQTIVGALKPMSVVFIAKDSSVIRMAA